MPQYKSYRIVESEYKTLILKDNIKSIMRAKFIYAHLDMFLDIEITLQGMPDYIDEARNTDEYINEAWETVSIED